MSHLSTTTHGGELSDRVVATLRTAVPALWGTVVAWLLARLVAVLPTDVADPLATALGSDVVIAVVVALVIAAWYAVWRWLEPHVPAWLVRIVLGSARTPAYAPMTPDGVAVITTLSAAEQGAPALHGRAPCDECGAPSTHTATPGGFRFCDDHRRSA